MILVCLDLVLLFFYYYVVNLLDRVWSEELVQSPVDSSPPISSSAQGLWGTETAACLCWLNWSSLERSSHPLHTQSQQTATAQLNVKLAWLTVQLSCNF